ncbi:MAG: glycoside hydrolase family 18 protein [Paludisphaera borealis]|uniref:glycoside hydrolase family 18 protein n=1 Tax=Paludisphaera borealis TaxID=1387353 RepID=UPI0028476C25|nr:glycoside hydrolase family 18 protein [Paludisphaera borealis]MDR3623300.1 glycoside hydrolase family 18 protein [Paludisphaera borealis]
MRRTALRRMIAAPVLLAGLLSSGFAADVEAKRDKVFVGYLYGSPRDVNFSLYTHLCHAFVTAGPDGKLNRGRSAPDRDLTALAHKAGVKVLISLGGWGWDKQFAAIVASPEAEKLYVDSVVKMLDEFDYDGLDLDWEYPDTAKEVEGFERLTRTLRSRIDAIGKTKNRPMNLTMAASSNQGTLEWLKKDFLVENMDWVNVMTYDYAGDWTPYAGHNSPLFPSTKEPAKTPKSIEATMLYLLEKRGIPADRLAVGLPLYGRGFNVAKPYDSTKGAPKKRLPNLDYRGIVGLEKEGWKRSWDEEIKAPWLTAPDGATVVGYDDAESLRLKTEWAMSKGFRGVFFWQVAGDRLPTGGNPLQEAARKAWEAGRGK